MTGIFFSLGSLIMCSIISTPFISGMLISAMTTSKGARSIKSRACIFLRPSAPFSALHQRTHRDARHRQRSPDHLAGDLGVIDDQDVQLHDQLLPVQAAHSWNCNSNVATSAQSPSYASRLMPQAFAGARISRQVHSFVAKPRSDRLGGHVAHPHHVRGGINVLVQLVMPGDGPGDFLAQAPARDDLGSQIGVGESDHLEFGLVVGR